jgi:hypothetical protein
MQASDGAAKLPDPPTIASDWDGTEAKLYRAGLPAAPLPTAQDLENLAEEMGQLIGEINQARLGGWLAEAFAKSQR